MAELYLEVWWTS